MRRIIKLILLIKCSHIKKAYSTVHIPYLFLEKNLMALKCCYNNAPNVNTIVVVYGVIRVVAIHIRVKIRLLAPIYACKMRWELTLISMKLALFVIKLI